MNTSRPIDGSVEKEEIEFSLLGEDISKASHEVLLQNADQELLEGAIEAPHHPIIGILFMVISWIAFSGSFTIIKLLYNSNPNITFNDSILSKSILPIFIYSYFAKKQHVNLFKMRRQIAILLVLRVTFGVWAMAMITFAINYISVSVNTIITNLAPIYMAFLAFVILKENITKIEITITFFGFFGVYLISLDKPSDPVDRSNYLLGITINIVASIFMAWGYICLRKINTTESPLFSPFYFFSGATWFAFCWMIYSPKYIPKVGSYSLFDVILLILGQCTALISQTTMSMAYKHEKASRLAPFIYLQVVFAILADLIIFRTSFSLYQITGMAIISVWLLIPAFMKYYGYLK